jgi:hypothetical protein
MLATKGPFHTALNRATQALLEEMVRAIMELMDFHPELGHRKGSDAWLAQSGVPPALPGRPSKFDSSGKCRNSLP